MSTLQRNLLELDGTSHTAAVQGRPRDRRLDLDILGRRRGGRAAGHDEGMASIRWGSGYCIRKVCSAVVFEQWCWNGRCRKNGRSKLREADPCFLRLRSAQVGVSLGAEKAQVSVQIARGKATFKSMVGTTHRCPGKSAVYGEDGMV